MRHAALKLVGWLCKLACTEIDSIDRVNTSQPNNHCNSKDLHIIDLRQSIVTMDSNDIAGKYSLPLFPGVRVHALFGVTFLVQVINTGLRHGGLGAYWAYMLILEGPVMLSNLMFIYKCQQLWAKWNQYPEGTAVLWSYGR